MLASALAACEGWAAWQERETRRAVAEDHLDDAQRHIDLALQVRRNRLSTLLLAARIARLRGRYSEAEQLLTRCGEQDGMSERVELEWLLLRCERGQVDELAPSLRALAAGKHAESAAILETLAGVYMRKMRYLEALECLDQWLELQPDSIRALDWRGWISTQLDHRDRTFSDYDHLLKLQPNRSDIRLRLAQVLVESKRYPDALPHLERLRREQPHNADVGVALALCWEVQVRTNEARQLLDEVLKEHPDHFDALLQRGRLELTLGHPVEAEAWLRKALEQKPHSTDAMYSLAESLRRQPNRQKEAEAARQHWKEENDLQTRLTRLLRRDLAANPRSADLACEAGTLLLQQGEEERGLFWLKRALALDEGHLPTQRALRAYFERTNKAALEGKTE